MKSENEIRKQIKELLQKMENIPTEVKKGEEELWRSFSQGGISALYWVIEEENPYVK